jgi:hypothetical protein
MGICSKDRGTWVDGVSRGEDGVMGFISLRQGIPSLWDVNLVEKSSLTACEIPKEEPVCQAEHLQIPANTVQPLRGKLSSLLLASTESAKRQ